MNTSKLSASIISLATVGGALLAVASFGACGTDAGTVTPSTGAGGGQVVGAGGSGNNAGGSGPNAGGSAGSSGSAVNTGGAAGTGNGIPPGTGGAGGPGGNPGAGVGGTPVIGADGAVIVEKLCAHKVTLQNNVFANFENYNGMAIDPATQYGFQWGGPTAGTGSDIAGVYGFSGGVTNFVLSFKAGHDATSNWALDYTLTNEAGFGGGVGFWMNPSCLNASAYKGLSFWARGQSATGVFSAVMSTEDTTPPAANPAGGGTCPGTADTCKPAFTADLALTPDWTPYQITWAMMNPGLRAGVAVVPTGDNIVGVIFQVGLVYVPRSDAGDLDAGFVPIPGSADLQIDDVSFIP